MKKINDELHFISGHKMKNRFMLAPMTNTQSHEDGTLSDDEYNWLVMRAKGNFGLTMTCAAHVQANGQGFPGQLGIFNEIHKEGHEKLSKGIKAYDSLAVIQLHHAGMRSPEKLIGEQAVCPSDDEKTGSRALSLQEVQALRDDFILAAKRAKDWGYDGVEIHGAHGYIICQFLSKKYNHRTDEYGGSLENRARLLFEIVDGVRATCGQDFLLGVRLSPERFGLELEEIKTVTQQLVDTEKVDFMDISLWDCFNKPEEDLEGSKTLLEHFTELNYKDTLLTVAGKIMSAEDVNTVLAQKVDFVTIGKAGILHHDFPDKVMANNHFKAIDTPVSVEHLTQEGLSKKFIEYMSKWPNFVAEK